MNTIMIAFYFGGQLVSSHPVAATPYADAYTVCQLEGEAVVDGVNRNLKELKYGNAAYACEVVTDGVAWSGE